MKNKFRRQEQRLWMALVVASSLFTVFTAPGAFAQTFSWNLPTAYSDSTLIPDSLRSTLKTRLYYSRDMSTWIPFAIVDNGGSSWTGQLPLAGGVQGYYALTAKIGNEGPESERSAAVAYPALPGDGIEVVTVILDKCEDTYVNLGKYALDQNSGIPHIRTYTWPAGKVANRGFIKWDLSSLPADIVVVNSTLRLFYAAEDGGGRSAVYNVGVGKVKGVNPNISSCNWYTYDGISPWTGGRDGGAANLDPVESSAGIGTAHGWVTWDVTKMVREWIESPGTNFGMAIFSDNSAPIDSNRYFASRENPDVSLRPQLVVTYRNKYIKPVTVSLDNCLDTYVNFGSYAANRYAAEPQIRTYTWPVGNVANRGFMKWDLSSLPSGITVSGAALYLYYVDEGGSGGDDLYTVSVARVTGVNPDLSLCNWNTYNGVAPWTGGDDGGAANLADAESAVGIDKTHGWVKWDITKMVQEWIFTPETNLGVAIDADNFASADSNRYFASREHPDPSLRPRLEITYKPYPE
jgi:hypothetical protein